MDDSYIFAKSIHRLQFFCLPMERFQFAYNWLTQWSKTTVYILEDPSIESETVAMLSLMKTPGKDPWTITYHPVNVTTTTITVTLAPKNQIAEKQA